MNEPSLPPVIRQGGAGNETFRPETVAEVFALGGGADRIEGPVKNFFGDTIQEFGLDDEIVLFDVIRRDQMTVSKESTIIRVDTDGDGASDGSFTL